MQATIRYSEAFRQQVLRDAGCGMGDSGEWTVIRLRGRCAPGSGVTGPPSRSLRSRLRRDRSAFAVAALPAHLKQRFLALQNPAAGRWPDYGECGPTPQPRRGHGD
jgi:hypothetical protein